MPGGDRTGPFGTFRNCMPVDAGNRAIAAPFNGRRFFGRGYGRGFGRGYGFGRGMGWRFYAAGYPAWEQPYSAGQPQSANTPAEQAVQQEKEFELKALQQELQEIKKRIEELKNREE